MPSDLSCLFRSFLSVNICFEDVATFNEPVGSGDTEGNIDDVCEPLPCDRVLLLSASDRYSTIFDGIYIP